MPIAGASPNAWNVAHSTATSNAHQTSGQRGCSAGGGRSRSRAGRRVAGHLRHGREPRRDPPAAARLLRHRRDAALDVARDPEHQQDERHDDPADRDAATQPSAAGTSGSTPVTTTRPPSEQRGHVDRVEDRHERGEPPCATRAPIPARCSTQPVSAIPPAPPAEKTRVATTPASVSSEASRPVEPRRHRPIELAGQHHVAAERDRLGATASASHTGSPPSTRSSSSSRSSGVRDAERHDHHGTTAPITPRPGRGCGAP